MNLAQQALENLFPERNEERSLLVEYSGKFSAYNANVKYGPTFLKFSLSKEWKEISVEIQSGIIEHLLCKVYGIKKPSTNQDLYHSFMKHMAKVARISEKDPYLQERFQIINEQYFNGLMSEPNLRWGKQAYRKLGHYEYTSDSIVISSIFAKASTDEKTQNLLDFVMYHEMLHKKHQYDHKKERAIHHSKAFREEEKLWPDKQIEKKLSWFLSKKKIKKALLEW